MNMNQSKISSGGFLLLLAVLFVALSIIAGQLFSKQRLDLTENNLYTLSDGTRNILRQLEQPVTLRLYFSEDASSDLPQIRRYAERVTDLLEEMEAVAGERLEIRLIDPQPFTDAEDEAVAYGLQGLPINAAGDNLYLGIVGTNALDGLQVMPFADPQKETFLEYDLAKMVQGLGRPSAPRVALLSQLPMGAGMDPASGQFRQAWVIREQLAQLFEVIDVDAGGDSLPEDVGVLVVVHPKQLGQGMLYAIDQFVLGGGRLVAFVDPLAEADPAAGDPNDPMAALSAGGSASSLGPLFEAWGVTFSDTGVVGDRSYALQVGMGPGQPPVRHLGILGLPRNAMNQQDIVSAELEMVNLSSAGHFRLDENSPLAMEALLQSSDASAELPAARLQMLTDPASLQEGFSPTGEQFDLAVRLTGPASSAFGEQPPEGIDGATHIASSAEPVNLLLFGDTDLLSDRFWVQRQSFFGQSITNSFADNGTLVVNAVDNMLGNADLISIRARATSTRPFERVEALRLAAEQQLLSREELLQQQLAETEQRLTELQASRDDADLAVLSAEQQAELERFTRQRLQIRKDLRDVRRELDHEIDALGTRLKVINIIIVPLAVALVAWLLASRRRRRART